MLVLSAGWSFRDSVAAPSERLLDAARAELFSVSPERACGLSPSRCRYDILMDRPLHAGNNPERAHAGQAPVPLGANLRFDRQRPGRHDRAAGEKNTARDAIATGRPPFRLHSF
jgi:hypothetical protein